MHPQTFLSFWHVEMSNFLAGTFRKRALSSSEALGIVSAARASGTLVCVAKDDLGAPYCKYELEHHRQLCAALRGHADIGISVRDFFNENYANPLCLARLGEQRSLVVVDCLFTYDDTRGPDLDEEQALKLAETPNARAKRLMKEAIKMQIVPSTISFHIFEHVDSTT